MGIDSAFDDPTSSYESVMQKVIFKYPIVKNFFEPTIIAMPMPNKFLSVKLQDDNIVLWFEFDSNNPDIIKFEVTLVATGILFNDLEVFGVYLDTIIDGNLVYHVYGAIR